jgi:hypothetical protein
MDLMDKTTLARNIMLMEAAREACAAAHAAGIPVILLKGAALLEQGICRLDERQMTDVDLLLKPGDLDAFEKLVSDLGYGPLDGSSQAWHKILSPEAPPLIIDVHTGLRHIKDPEALWRTAGGTPVGKNAMVLSLPDQFLHLASHALLNHGRLGDRTLQDLARLLEHAYRGTWGKPLLLCPPVAQSPGRGAARTGFWLETAALSDLYALSPAVHPVLERLASARPQLAGAGELVLFEPRGLGKIKRRFFAKAAQEHSNFLEYFLPVLYRPGLFISGLFPGRKFLKRRYGNDSWTNQFRRPFQLLRNVFARRP